MKIFDCFTFFSTAELDLLEIRMKYLRDTVDYFTIAESNLTHSGKSKPYILEANWERFKPLHDKMIYLQIEQSIEGLTFDSNLTRYTDTDGAWVLEKQQRQALAMIDEQVSPEDFVMVGDLDEIPNIAAIRDLSATMHHHYPIPLAMYYYAGFLNNQNIIGPDRSWNGTVICRGDGFKAYGPQELREQRNGSGGYHPGGWHFTYQGGIPAIQNKLRSFAHTEFNRVEILNENRILKAIEAGEDVLGRTGVKYELQPMSSFPDDLRTILEQYPHLIKSIA